MIAPHIDFARGGHVYTWAYRTLVEESDADVFIILGVAHQYTRQRFTLTRQDFQTPLGVVRTDLELVETLAERLGPQVFADEHVHRPEHSIEFQAVFVQHLLGGRRDFRIVPILVGSFHDMMRRGVDPIEDRSISDFVKAIQRIEANTERKVMYLGSIDLCHVGPEFGDTERVSDATLGEVRAFDESMLACATSVDPRGWFSTAARVDDRYRVCGLAANYVMLHALESTQGELLRYDQAVDARRVCCVSFASLAFRSGPIVPEGTVSDG